MKFVRFTGSTPYRDTQYHALLAFSNETPESEVQRQSREYSLENGMRFEYLLQAEHEGKDHLEKAFLRCDYLQKCVELGRYEYLTQQEFEVAFAEDD